MKKHNFNAGPAILPKKVLKKSSEAILNFKKSGLSLLEISHRSSDFLAIYEEAVSLVKEILNVPSTHEVLFLQGGASMQFLITAINLMKEKNGKAAYLDTGTWSSKAIKEASLFGKVEILASSKDKNYTYIPKNYKIPKDVDYIHLTSNNTIFGTQIKDFPSTDIPLVCDMSSDIFSRKIDVSSFGIIYAGAQKNLGPAGTTLVILKMNILGKTGRMIPSMLDLKLMIEKESMFNTPPVFSIYACMLNLRFMKKNGGIKILEKKNNKKAKLLYNEIDKNSAFVNLTTKDDRSPMNIIFSLHDESKTDDFLLDCQNNNIVGIKGHRSVGGFRASIYNAMRIKSVKSLIKVMRKFNNQNEKDENFSE